MIRFFINQDILKMVALVLMTIDHVGMFFAPAPWAVACRLIGRASYPLFAYLLMMNLAKYQVFGKYLIRLGFFGFISFLIGIPIQSIFNVQTALPLNILISFWVAVATLFVFQKIEKLQMPIYYRYLLFLPVLALGGATSVLTAYEFPGFCFLIALYFFFLKGSIDWMALILFFSYLINLSFLGPIVSLLVTVFLLLFVQVESQPRLLKHWWIFYVYYPAHIVVLSLIAYFL
ncbi:MAG: hypothetical protein IKR60_00465 [Alphaproteobacteria bacterium]|nr:hypothetical protein [Alphaproteobacteria bacterium]